MLLSSSSFSILPANESDIRRIAELIAAAFADVALRFDLTRENCPTHTSFTTDADIQRCMGFGTTFLLAFDGECACGCISFRQPKNGISIFEKIGVLPKFRHRGLGNALVAQAADQAYRQGATLAEIGVIEDHHELIAWYGKIGFTCVRKARFKHLPFGVVNMQMPLGN
jgi:diamine N-acetyltransferase